MPTRLENALLSLDAYNRGYNRQLRVDSNHIGNFLFQGNEASAPSIDQRAAHDAGFSASWYTSDLGLGTVISYRGTDNPTPSDDEQSGGSDVMKGWVMGGGSYDTPQASMAIKFYEAVASRTSPGTSIYDQTQPGNIFLTGHSLGGGLAEYVAALSAGTAVIFDNMPTINTAQRTLDHEFGQSSGRTVSTDGITHYWVNGEVLELVRSGFVQTLADSFLLLGGLSVPVVVSIAAASGIYLSSDTAASLMALVLIDPAGSGAYASESQLDGSEISSYSMFGIGTPNTLISTINYHSQALLVNLVFAEENVLNNNWHLVARETIGHILDDSIASSIGFVMGGDINQYTIKDEISDGDRDNDGIMDADVTGAGAPGSQMAHAIAYSSITYGGMPYGNVAIRAMFNDANDLGDLFAIEVLHATTFLEAAQPSVWNWLHTNLDTLGIMLIKNAGQLAKNAEDDQSYLEGVLDSKNNELGLTIKVTSVTEDYIPSFLQGTALSAGSQLSTLIGQAPISSYTFSMGGPVDVLPSGNGIHVGLLTDGAGRLEGTAADDVLVGNGGNDTLKGGGGNNILWGGGGQDELHTGSGNDHANSGADNDLIYGSVGTDVIDGAEGQNDILDFLYSTTGIHTGGAAVSFDMSADWLQHLTTTFSGIEQLRGSDTTDLFEVSSLSPGDLRGRSGDDRFVLDSTMSDAGSVTIKISGGDDNDTVDFSRTSGAITYRLSDGLYHLTGGNVVGIEGVETLIFGSNRYDVEGRDDVNQVDIMRSGQGESTVHGRHGRDIITIAAPLAGAPRSEAFGDEGDDIISMEGAGVAHGGADNDVITGSSGADKIYGDSGQDRISAGGDNDEILGGTGGDVINGGDGHDKAIYEADAELVFVSRSADGFLVCITRNGSQTKEYDLLINVEEINLPGKTIDLTALAVGSVIKGSGFNATFIETAIRTAPGIPAFSLPGNAYDNPPYSPLILDMDGDGIEVSNVTSSATYFDMNLDGFAERTAWVKPDDALLVMDRDGNGAIDNSGELFGSNSTNGFITLALLDTNSDGIVSALDAQYGQLRLWQDANSNGITDSGELIDLATSSIETINLAASVINETNAGNPVTHRSTYTRADGSTGRIDDVWFKPDLEYAHDKGVDNWTPAAAVMGLPTLVSYGTARNMLWSLDHDAGLKAKAEALVVKVNAGDMVGFRNDFQEFVKDWLDVDPTPGKQGYGQHIERSHYAVLKTLHGADMPYGGGDYLGGAASNMLEIEYQHAIDTMAAKFLSQAAQLSALANGATGALLDAFSSTAFSYANDSLQGDLLATGTTIGSLLKTTGGQQAGTALHFLLQTIDDAAMKTSVLNAAVAAAVSADADGIDLAIFKGYANAFTIINQDTQETFLTTGYNNVINGTAGNDTLAAADGNDLIDPGMGNDVVSGSSGDNTMVYRRGYGADTFTNFFSQYDNWSNKLVFAKDILSTDVSFQLMADGVSVRVTISSTDSVTLTDLLNYPAAGLTLEFGDNVKWTAANIAARFIAPTEGDDDLAGSAAADTINAGGGNDIVHGNSGADVISGGAGNDILYGNYGNDTLNGGLGDDTLYGGDRNDTYVYAIGDGNDRIYARYDTYADYGVDKITMGPGIAATDLAFSQSADGHDLIITLAQGGSLTIVDGFWNTNTYSPYARIGSIVLNNGTIISSETMLASTLTGDAGDNILHAIPDAGGGSVLTGNAGNDSLYGWQFNDTLLGGAGNDLLDGNVGNDSMTGGTGDDNIVTGPGDDVIYYNMGDGSDTIVNQGGYYNYGSYTAGADRIVFGNGFQATDLTFTQVNVGRDLLVALAQGGTLLITGGVSATPAIASFQFADGSSIAGSVAVAATMVNGAGNQTLYDTTGSDVFQGGAGDDVIHSGQGNDVFKYDLGDGRDTIWKIGYSGLDTVLFGPNLTPALVHFTASLENSYDVVASMPDGGSITLKAELQNGGPANYTPLIEAFTFADGTSYTMAQVQAFMKTPTALSDVLRDMSGTINALAGDDTVFANGAINLNAGDGNDTVYGSAGVDTINGDSGNDYIVGGNGSDILNGGAGNDTIYGNGLGPDMYGYVDEIHGGDGDDYIYGNLYNTNMTGDAGIDTLDLSGVSASYPWTVDLSLTTNPFKFGSTGRNYTGFEKVMLGAGADIVKTSSTTVLIDAGAGNDVITGSTGPATLIGGSGDDQITGGSGNETIRGDGGNDTLRGGDGDDIVYADVSDITVSGDAGTDTIYISSVVAGIIDLNLTSGQFRFSTGTRSWTGFENIVMTGIGNDTIRASSSTLLINGGIGNDFIYGTAGGAMVLIGGAGSDTLYAQSGVNMTLNGGSEQDTIYGGAGANALNGDDGNDIISGGSGSETINGGTGADQITGGGGNNLIVGGAGNDSIQAGLQVGSGTNATNTVYGGLDNDTIYDGYGSTTIDGGDGDDIIYSYAGYYRGNDYSIGAQTLTGGSGNDTFYVTTLNAAIDGGVGIDKVAFYFPNMGRSILVEDNGNQQNVTMFVNGTEVTLTYYGIEGFGLAATTTGMSNSLMTASGSSADNWFGGGTMPDTLRGNGGNDTLLGYGGNDRLYGGNGSDIIVGGTGNDEIDGGNYDLGVDTVRVDKAASWFTMTTDSFGVITMTDNDTSTSSLGVDTIRGMELFETTTGTIALSTPIVLDLNGDGIHLTGIDTGVRFDMDGDGFADNTGWFSQGDAVLVRDLDGDGYIRTGSELSFTQDMPGALTDMQGLATHDEDGNHRIDSADAIWSDLRLWLDDGDGVQQAGELKTMEDAGVNWIGLDTVGNSSVHALGESLIFGTSSFGRVGGGTGMAADAAFAFDPTTIAARGGTLAGNVFMAPEDMPFVAPGAMDFTTPDQYEDAMTAFMPAWNTPTFASEYFIA